MTIIVEWDNEDQSTLCLRYDSRWDWDDFNAAEIRMVHLLDSVDHPVDLVFDVASGSFPPPGAMPRFRAIVENEHPNVRQLVFVGPRLLVGFIQSLTRIMTSLYGKSFKVPAFIFVPNMDEARKMLAVKNAAVVQE